MLPFNFNFFLDEPLENEDNIAPAGTEMANALAEAKRAAGPEIINTTLVIPIFLIIAFAILFFYMRGRNRKISPATESLVESQPIL